jgi:hypothetical protein
MTNNLKNLKEEIEKLAAVPGSKAPTAPAAGIVPPQNSFFHKNTPTDAKPSVRGPVKGPSNPAVREMQLAMQDLAESVMHDANSATMSLKNKDVVHQEAAQPVQQSKKSFNDFIAEQYMGGLDESNKGVEWNKDSKVVTHPDKHKTQTDIYELDVVMNTLSRIGSEKSEFKADGNWDWRTNNALKNMLGFAYALLQIEGDFGLDNHIYNSSNWTDFKNTLSGYRVEGNVVDLSAEEKTTKAAKITKHLKAITRMYNEFRQQVIARPEFRPFIEGKRSFDKYDQHGSNKETLNPTEQQMANSDITKVDNIVYPAPRLPDKQLHYVPLKALSSKEEFLKWMLNYAGIPNEAGAWHIFNTVIKPKIEAL